MHVYEPGKTFIIDEIKDCNYPDKKESNKITADEISDQIIRKYDLRVSGLMQTAKFLKDNDITCTVRHSDIVKMMKGDDEGNKLLKKIESSI